MKVEQIKYLFNQSDLHLLTPERGFFLPLSYYNHNNNESSSHIYEELYPPELHFRRLWFNIMISNFFIANGISKS